MRHYLNKPNYKKSLFEVDLKLTSTEADLMTTLSTFTFAYIPKLEHGLIVTIIFLKFNCKNSQD